MQPDTDCDLGSVRCVGLNQIRPGVGVWSNNRNRDGFCFFGAFYIQVQSFAHRAGWKRALSLLPIGAGHSGAPSGHFKLEFIKWITCGDVGSQFVAGSS